MLKYYAASLNKKKYMKCNPLTVFGKKKVGGANCPDAAVLKFSHREWQRGDPSGKRVDVIKACSNGCFHYQPLIFLLS